MPHKAHHGHVTVIPYSWGTFTPGAVTTNVRVGIPYNCKVMEISLSTASSAGGASRPTVQITDGANNLLSGSATLTSGGTVVLTPTSSPSLVAAQRVRVRGNELQIQVTTVASEAVVGFVCLIHVRADSHVPVSPADE